MKKAKALLVLALSSALTSCLHEQHAGNNSRELAWSAFEEVCLSLMPDHTAIIRHASAQGWRTVAEGEATGPPKRLSRGPHRSWRIDEAGKTIILGIEVLGDRATAEQMLAGEDPGGAGMLFCNIHFEGGGYEDITRDISSLTIEQRALGPHGAQLGGQTGWVNRIWGIGRDGLYGLDFAFVPNGNGRFIEISAKIGG